MSGANTFGRFIKVTSFGESHGSALGVVIDGLPAGIDFDENLLFRDLERRRPGSTWYVSKRSESDQPEILSGIYKNKTLGSPIAVIVRNQDAKSESYTEIEKSPRIGHADDVYKDKYQYVDHRGGGRSSGRETLARVIAASFCKMYLKKIYPDLKVVGWAQQIGSFIAHAEEIENLTRSKIDHPADLYFARFPAPKNQTQDIESFFKHLIDTHDSMGGFAKIQIQNPPKNLGQPVFHKLKSDLASAMMSVGATLSFELGDSQQNLLLKGSEFHQQMDSTRYAGIRGGISTGEDIELKVGIKPTSSILDISKKGRHDPCILVRAIPVLEAMAILVITDQIMARKLEV